MSNTTTSSREKQLLTVAEVAEMLGVAQRTVWAWTSDGTLPKPLRKGTRWCRWRRKEIQAWIDDRA